MQNVAVQIISTQYLFIYIVVHVESQYLHLHALDRSSSNILGSFLSLLLDQLTNWSYIPDESLLESWSRFLALDVDHQLMYRSTTDSESKLGAWF
jgi:hypothetical protein